MPRKIYLVALDDVNAACQWFDELSIKDPDEIRRKFKEKQPPKVLYEEGDRMKARVVGQDEFIPGTVYVWFAEKKAWEKPDILQNALFCSKAVYEENPLQYLKQCKIYHTVYHVIAVGDYKLDETPVQRCMLVLSENPETKDKTLIAAFRGSENTEDWLSYGLGAWNTPQNHRLRFHFFFQSWVK